VRNQTGRKIDAMQPNGNTNQAIGLPWGWAAARPALQMPADHHLAERKASTRRTAGIRPMVADARQQIACNNINVACVTLYTGQVSTAAFRPRRY
jgi:hypothetical protein